MINYMTKNERSLEIGTFSSIFFPSDLILHMNCWRVGPPYPIQHFSAGMKEYDTQENKF